MANIFYETVFTNDNYEVRVCETRSRGRRQDGDGDLYYAVVNKKYKVIEAKTHILSWAKKYADAFNSPDDDITGDVPVELLSALEPRGAPH